MKPFESEPVRRALSAARLIGMVAAATLPTGVVAQGFDQDPLYKDMTDVAKALVVETTARFNGDYRGLCKHDTAKLTVEVSDSTKSLRAKGQWTAGPGFYEIEAINFFTKKCRIAR